jgi:hypothetical protein
MCVERAYGSLNLGKAALPEAAIEITPEMIEAAYAVLRRYRVCDVLEIDSDIMRAMLSEAFSVKRNRNPSSV